MKSRKLAVELIANQLDHLCPPPGKKVAHHYGKVELRNLMDFIYESEPKHESEKLK